MTIDKSAMQRAIELSAISSNCGGGPFGAVVVRGTEIVGEGINLVVAHKDPTAHAEVMAIRDACRFLGTHNLVGCVLYSSARPCPMCVGAILWARLDHVFYAAHDVPSCFDDQKFHGIVMGPGANNIECIVGDDNDFTQVEASEKILLAWAAKKDKVDY